MLLQSRLSKLVQIIEALHTAPDDTDEVGAKAHCIVKGQIIKEDYPWALLASCIWLGKRPCDGCICARPTDLEEIIDACRTSSGDVK